MSEEPRGARVPLAVIDIGSNSGHVVAYRVEPGGGFRIQATTRASLRLVREVEKGHALSEEAIERTIEVLRDFRGHYDANGYELHTTVIAIADEIAAAAELVMGKLEGVPAAVVRGLDVVGEGTARDIVMPREQDLFQ